MKEKIREINIREVANGYIVRIGCCEFVFKQDELIKELTEYIKEPRKTEIGYMKEYEIRDDVQPVVPIGELPRYTAVNHPGLSSLNHPGEGSRSGPIRND